MQTRESDPDEYAASLLAYAGSQVTGVAEMAEAPGATPAGSTSSNFRRNSLISVGRLLASALVALVLPAYLTHKLPLHTYSAWVLLLQMGAYVGYLDFGVQTGISKYVAEYEARGDLQGANSRASAGLAVMVFGSVLGVLLTLILAWRVPHIFFAMPPALLEDVRLSLIFIGFSLSFGLLCAVPGAIFMGLQRYGVPTAVSIINRILYTTVIIAAVYWRGSLALMGALVAAVNVATGVLQVVAWRKLAGHIRLSLRKLDRAVFRQMVSYCSVLAIWTVGMLCVSGLDVTIVGRYDFGQTAFYSVATLPTNFVASLVGAALGPLLPAASALSAQRGPAAMGDLLGRLTRYAVLLLGVTGIPMMVAGYWILSLWVGPTYATHTLGYLRMLVLANIFRTIGVPYATMLVATESQKIAIGGAVAEAVVNLTASIYLAKHMGAIGVAYGTLLGSFVSLGMHFFYNMHFTQGKFAIGRARLIFGSVVRPAMIAVPSAACVLLWWTSRAPTLSPVDWTAWAASSVLLGWFAGLSSDERTRLLALANRFPQRSAT